MTDRLPGILVLHQSICPPPNPQSETTVLVAGSQWQALVFTAKKSFINLGFLDSEIFITCSPIIVPAEDYKPYGYNYLCLFDRSILNLGYVCHILLRFLPPSCTVLLIRCANAPHAKSKTEWHWKKQKPWSLEKTRPLPNHWRLQPNQHRIDPRPLKKKLLLPFWMKIGCPCNNFSRLWSWDMQVSIYSNYRPRSNAVIFYRPSDPFLDQEFIYNFLAL